MEQDAKEILSPLLSRQSVMRQFERLEEVVDQAQKRIDYTIAHDRDILKAVEIVERFLRKKKRVCYGGQAINAQLPKARKFYDDKYDLPDYDFFTPSLAQDVNELMEMLEKEGYDVSKKVGIHEGTINLLVNYVVVADCTELHPDMFRVLFKRATVVSGIYYCDPDFLRMMMYLELSRPRGQVARWKKVFERLTLLNHAFPLPNCNQTIQVNQKVNMQDRRIALEFCTNHKRVLVGPEVIQLMEKRKKGTSMDSLVMRGGPVMFMSTQAQLDADDIADMLEGVVRVENDQAVSDELFSYVTILRRNVPIAVLFQETACHSYSLLQLDQDRELRVGTPDLMLHLYYSLWLFGKKEKKHFETSLQCLIEKLYTLSEEARENPGPLLPSFGLRCSGHQKGYATLLKERLQRQEKERVAQATRKSKRSKLSKKTRRMLSQ